MGTHAFTTKEKEIIKLLRKNEMTKNQLIKRGYEFDKVFLLKCENNGILLYESDEENSNKKYGVLKWYLYFLQLFL